MASWPRTITALDAFYGTHRLGSPTIGWGPTYYGSRRLAFPVDLSLDALLLDSSLAASVVALVLCVASTRGRRLPTLLVGSVVLLAGYALLNGLTAPRWLVAEQAISSSFCVYTPFKVTHGYLKVGVGLSHYNVSYSDMNDPDVAYNDRFELVFGGPRFAVDGRSHHKLLAIRHGLPNPMITVAEYLEDGIWGRALPAAGVYARAWLYAAGCGLLTACAFTCAAPPLAPRAFGATGVLMLVSVAVFWRMLPPLSSSDLIVEGQAIGFFPGPTFWLMFSAGGVLLAFSAFCLTLSVTRGKAGVATFFELDYNTAFDDRILKEDSQRRKDEASSQRPSMATQFYVDARLRVTFRRLRASIKASSNRRRSMSVNVLDGDRLESGQETQAKDTTEEYHDGGLSFGIDGPCNGDNTLGQAAQVLVTGRKSRMPNRAQLNIRLMKPEFVVHL